MTQKIDWETMQLPAYTGLSYSDAGIFKIHKEFNLALKSKHSIDLVV